MESYKLSTHEQENKIKRYSRVQCKVMHDFTYRTSPTRYTIRRDRNTDKKKKQTRLHGMLIIKGDEELLAVSASVEALSGSK
jgi:hypothetical protein